MFTTLFAVGSLAFWILFVLADVIVVALIDHQKWGWSAITLFFTALTLAFLGDFNLIVFVRANPGHALYLLGLYFIIGAVWSVLKWYFFLLREREDYDKRRADFLKYRGLSANSKITPELKADFIKKLGATTRPSVHNHKSQVMGWLVYWPWSALWTLINDPIRRIWEWMFRGLRSIYETVAAHVYRGVEEDLRQPPKE